MHDMIFSDIHKIEGLLSFSIGKKCPKTVFFYVRTEAYNQKST